MDQDLDPYSEEIVREFYGSYLATLQGSIHNRAKLTKQDPLTYTICRFLYGPTTGITWSLNSVEFGYWWDTI